MARGSPRAAVALGALLLCLLAGGGVRATFTCDAACAGNACTASSAGPSSCTGGCNAGYQNASTGGGCAVSHQLAVVMTLNHGATCAQVGSPAAVVQNSSNFVTTLAVALGVPPTKVYFSTLACQDAASGVGSVMTAGLFVGSLDAASEGAVESALTLIPSTLPTLSLSTLEVTVAQVSLGTVTSICASTCRTCVDASSTGCYSCGGKQTLKGSLRPSSCESPSSSSSSSFISLISSHTWAAYGIIAGFVAWGVCCFTIGLCMFIRKVRREKKLATAARANKLGQRGPGMKGHDPRAYRGEHNAERARATPDTSQSGRLTPRTVAALGEGGGFQRYARGEEEEEEVYTEEYVTEEGYGDPYGHQGYEHGDETYVDEDGYTNDGAFTPYGSQEGEYVDYVDEGGYGARSAAAADDNSVIQDFSGRPFTMERSRQLSHTGSSSSVHGLPLDEEVVLSSPEAKHAQPPPPIPRPLSVASSRRSDNVGTEAAPAPAPDKAPKVTSTSACQTEPIAIAVAEASSSDDDGPIKSGGPVLTQYTQAVKSLLVTEPRREVRVPRRERRRSGGRRHKHDSSTSSEERAAHRRAAPTVIDSPWTDEALARMAAAQRQRVPLTIGSGVSVVDQLRMRDGLPVSGNGTWPQQPQVARLPPPPFVTSLPPPFTPVGRMQWLQPDFRHNLPRAPTMSASTPAPSKAMPRPALKGATSTASSQGGKPAAGTQGTQPASETPQAKEKPTGQASAPPPTPPPVLAGPRMAVHGNTTFFIHKTKKEDIAMPELPSHERPVKTHKMAVVENTTFYVHKAKKSSLGEGESMAAALAGLPTSKPVPPPRAAPAPTPTPAPAPPAAAKQAGSGVSVPGAPRSVTFSTGPPQSPHASAPDSVTSLSSGVLAGGPAAPLTPSWGVGAVPWAAMQSRAASTPDRYGLPSSYSLTQLRQGSAHTHNHVPHPHDVGYWPHQRPSRSSADASPLDVLWGEDEAVGGGAMSKSGRRRHKAKRGRRNNSATQLELSSFEV